MRRFKQIKRKPLKELNDNNNYDITHKQKFEEQQKTLQTKKEFRGSFAAMEVFNERVPNFCLFSNFKDGRLANDTEKDNKCKEIINAASCELTLDFSYRDNHVIPEGDDYLKMFQNYKLMATQFMFMENKSFNNTTFKYEHKLFNNSNMKMLQYGEEPIHNDDTIREAEENLKEILTTYKNENKVLRRNRYIM